MHNYIWWFLYNSYHNIKQNNIILTENEIFIVYIIEFLSVLFIILFIIWLEYKIRK
jgi:hypothetical protein